MSEYTKLATEAGDQYLAAVSESQKMFLKSLEPFQAMAKSMPTMPMPEFTSDFPTPKEIADAQFAFAKKLLKQQQDFTNKLFATGTPAS